MSNLNELKTALGAGARASKYRVNFAFPTAVPIQSDMRYADVLCKATSFPSVTVGQIEVFNQGRKLPIPGDTTFTTTWTVTFYGTEGHDLRRDMIAWLASCDHFQANKHSGQPGALMTDLSVSQLDSAGNPTATYTFHNAWVQEIAEISVGDDQVDTIIEYDVTFSFSDWVVGGGELQSPSTANAPTLNETALE